MTAGVRLSKLNYGWSFCLLVVLLSSCSSKQYQVLFQKKRSLTDSGYSVKDSVGEYRIRPQDILQVRNLQDAKKYLINPVQSNAVNTNLLADGTSQETGEQNFQVADDGTVILPALGHIRVAGLTRAVAEKTIEDAYRKNVLVNPIIELKIINLKVTMLGEVKNSGNFPLTKEHITLVEMIGAAGGITERADESNIKIIRGTEKEPKVIQVDLGDIKSVNDPRTILQNGDIIYVGQNKRANRTDNLQSVSTIVQPSLLLINAALIILTLFRK
ncbi:MAG: polysaccharide biosynthesis/export family protein [Mucilaginibacter sp.]